MMLCIMIIQWLSLTTRTAAGMNSLWDMQCRIIKGFMASFHLSVLFTSDMYLIVASLVVRLLIILIEVEKNLMQICWTEVLSWYWRWEANFKHIGATKDGFWSYKYWSWTLILTRFTQLMDQLKELDFFYVACRCYIEMCGAINGWKATTDK